MTVEWGICKKSVPYKLWHTERHRGERTFLWTSTLTSCRKVKGLSHCDLSNMLQDTRRLEASKPFFISSGHALPCLGLIVLLMPFWELSNMKPGFGRTGCIKMHDCLSNASLFWRCLGLSTVWSQLKMLDKLKGNRGLSRGRPCRSAQHKSLSWGVQTHWITFHWRRSLPRPEQPCHITSCLRLLGVI